MEQALRDERFEEFFDRGFDRCVAVARRITHDAALSEDLAAEAYARAWSRWARLAKNPAQLGWVVKVTTNLAIDTTRKRPIRPPRTDVIDTADAVATQQALIAALRVLPGRQREAIVLRYLADLPEDEAAAALGVTAGSVKTHVHRGLERLRELLRETDDTTVEDRLVHES